MGKDKKYILEREVLDKKLNRLALEIIENNLDEQQLVFVGIQSTGVILAKWLKKLIERQSDVKVDLITMKMDKQSPKDVVISTDFDFDHKSIILIDDVINSGKTLLHAMKPFLAFQPRKMQTLVLVERSHAQFPVRANYKGVSLATTLQESIVVEVEGERIVGAYLS